MRRNWQRQSKRCWLSRRWGRRWAGAENSAWRMNSASACLQNPSRKFCASYANPERDAIVRAVLRIWRAAGEGGSAGKRAGAARPRSDGADGGSGIRSAAENGKECRQGRTLALRVDARSERSEECVLADVVSLPGDELESGGEALLPSRAKRSRCCAHFWFV